MRVVWDTNSQTQVAVFQKYSTDLHVIDIRMPNVIQTTLQHSAQVNCACWYPKTNYICTVADNAFTNIWEVGSDQPAANNLQNP
jgi:hypothetical protein